MVERVALANLKDILRLMLRRANVQDIFEVSNGADKAKLAKMLEQLGNDTASPVIVAVLVHGGSEEIGPQHILIVG